MRQLRDECAWKRGQTHRSLARYLLEETHETLEAIDTGDADHLREELGDLLLQVYFHAVIAEESGEFTLDDVARGIADKMHRRNPHVFGDDSSGSSGLSAAEVNERWQEIKADESPGAASAPKTWGLRRCIFSLMPRATSSRVNSPDSSAITAWK